MYDEAHGFSKDSISRMKKGLAPQVEASDGNLYFLELHHIEHRSQGGTHEYNKLKPLTPWEHAKEHRHGYTLYKQHVEVCIL